VSAAVTTAGVNTILRLAAGGDSPGVADLAQNVRGYFSTPAQGLAAEVTQTSSPLDTVTGLAAFGLSSLDLVAQAKSADDCWAEFTRVEAAHGPETVVLGARANAEGEIVRVVLLAVPRVPGPVEPGAETAPQARGDFERYFAALQASRFADAAAQFSKDAVWSHPPYGGSPDRELARGRKELVDIFVSKRGPSPVVQLITGFWQSGDKVFLEGVVEGIPNGGSFVGIGQTTTSGEINRYVAFYSAARFA
jgi:hypothetical protein